MQKEQPNQPTIIAKEIMAPISSNSFNTSQSVLDQFGNPTDVPDDQLIESIFAEKKTVHAEDAIDYEDIDELADDESPIESSSLRQRESNGDVDPDLGLENGVDVDAEVDMGIDVDDEFDQMIREQPELRFDEISQAEQHRAEELADDQFEEMFGDMGGSEEIGEVANDHFNNLDLHLGVKVVEEEDEGHNDFHDLDDMFEELGKASGTNETSEMKAPSDRNELRKLQRTTESESESENESENEKARIASREQKREKVRRAIQELELRRTQKILVHYFPLYSADKSLDFHKVLAPAPKYYRYARPHISFKKIVKSLVPTKPKLELDLDDKRLFKQVHSTAENNRIINTTTITQDDLEVARNLEQKRSKIDSFIKQLEYVKRDWHNDNIFKNYSKDLVLSNTDWDDEAILNAGDTIKDKQRRPFRSFYGHTAAEKAEEEQAEEEEEQQQEEEEEEESAAAAAAEDDNGEEKVGAMGTNGEIGKRNRKNKREKRTGHLFDEDIYEGRIDIDSFKLDLNDPNLLFVPQKDAISRKTKTSVLTHSALADRFKISNDDEYEVLRKNYNTKQRSQLSNLNIEHSVPALRLQTPYYKVKMSRTDLRSFHRPNFNVRPGTLVSFSRLKIRKKKKDKGKSLHEVFAKTTDLSTADTANIVALEYSEQYPFVLSNFGMGSKLINYYRKEKEDDTSRPKAQVGETHVLGLEDRSPFWNFGEVAPGDFVPTLYNNMGRAPIFKHDPRNTDFLLVSSQGAGSHQRYFLRAINFNFAVGNVFPSEIPAPHSRKVTNISKNRLKMIVYRVMNAKGAPRIVVKDVSKHFPEQTDMQSRQRLKEFMEYQRQGDDQGFWKVRGMDDNIPSEEDIRAMITPEDSAMVDIMQCGQQLIEDNSVLFGDKRRDAKKKLEGKDGKDSKEGDVEDVGGTDVNDDKKEKSKKLKEGESEIDLEEEMAPWNLSRNFVVANQTKAMLQLNGEGDPTGIGLGYSMLRASQKNPFKPKFPPPPEVVPKSNSAAYNQKLYEQEINRIWYSQRSSLVDHGPDFDLEQIYKEYVPADHEAYYLGKEKQDMEDDEQSFKKSEKKILKISRQVRDQHGILQRKTDIITDPRLIRAYIKRKKMLEDELLRNADVDEILPTNDKELNALRRKALEEKLANLEKRAKQSKAKKAPNDAIHAAAAAGATIIDANTVMMPDGTYVIGGKGIGKGKSTTRRCKSCGSFGHIRTNKACPLYNQMIAGLLPQKPDSAGSGGDSSETFSSLGVKIESGSPYADEAGSPSPGFLSGSTSAVASPSPHITN